MKEGEGSSISLLRLFDASWPLEGIYSFAPFWKFLLRDRNLRKKLSHEEAITLLDGYCIFLLDSVTQNLLCTPLTAWTSEGAQLGVVHLCMGNRDLRVATMMCIEEVQERGVVCPSLQLPPTWLCRNT